ncbi:MAG: type IV toxin-antitoxin system AbiEi family antitoxin domain-containing protein [archaeon]
MDIDFFNNLPFFTNEDLEAFTHKNHSYVLLTKLKKTNKIIQIEKGKYTLHDDPLIYASNIVYPSYISGLSALYYYGLTTQIPIKVIVLTKDVKRNNKYINFIQISNELFFGYEKKQYKNFEIFIANKEKLLIDSIYFQKLATSITDLEPLLREKLNKDSITNYLKKINNISLIKRVGYLLEKQNIDIYDEFKSKILKDKNYIKLEQNLPKTKNSNSKWRINVNI